MDLNNKSVDNRNQQSINVAIQPIYDEFKMMANDGQTPEEIIIKLMAEGVEATQMSQVLEAVGYSPSAVVDLFQSAQILEKQNLQQQQQPQQSQQPQEQQDPNSQAPSQESIMEMAKQAAQNTSQPQMAFGGSGNSGRGPVFGAGQPRRPLYLPPAAATGDLMGAAMLLDDAAGSLFGTKDLNGDGLRDGAFSDMGAKKARFKRSQEALNEFTINSNGSNIEDYNLNFTDLKNNTLRTNDQFNSDLKKYSLLDFNTDAKKYESINASSEEDYKLLGKDQIKNLNFNNTYDNVVGNLQNMDPTDLEMMVASKKYDADQGLNLNRSSYDGSTLSKNDLESKRSDYKDLMLGNQSMSNDNPFIYSGVTSPTVPDNTNSSILEKEKSIVSAPDSQLTFKEWAMQDPVTRMTSSAKQDYNNYLNNTPSQPQTESKSDLEEAMSKLGSFFNKGYDASKSFINDKVVPFVEDKAAPFIEDKAKSVMEMLENKRYGGALPKAQFSLPDMSFLNDLNIPSDSPMGPTPFQQEQGLFGKNILESGDFTDYFDPKTDYKRDTQIVADAQLQAGKKSNTDQTVTPPVEVAESTQQAQPAAPTVERKRSIGTGIKKAQNFIKNDPTVQAIGEASKFAVMGANFANELYDEKKARDRDKDLRGFGADKIFATVENPVNKRGTTDQYGLNENDMLVDSYAQQITRYGAELKKGGEFELHMMFDPITGKGYKANELADHERMKKLGYLHKDEMQGGGEIEVDNDTLAALIAAGADIEIL